jgi:hypothetical protein
LLDLRQPLRVVREQLEGGLEPIESSSESSASSLKSSETRYREEIRDATVAYVREGGDPEAFRARLAEIARFHGVSDWDGNQATWEGVGEGLARAKVTGVALESQKTTLTGSEPVRMNWIQTGYDRAKSQ